MRLALFSCFFVLLAAGCQHTVATHGNPAAAAPAATGQITYSIGVGATCDDPIVIQGAHGEPDGIHSEYTWVANHFPGYRITRQALVTGAAGKTFDRLDFTDGSGAKHFACFDISAFQGKF